MASSQPPDPEADRKTHITLKAIDSTLENFFDDDYWEKQIRTLEQLNSILGKNSSDPKAKKEIEDTIQFIEMTLKAHEIIAQSEGNHFQTAQKMYELAFDGDIGDIQDIIKALVINDDGNLKEGNGATSTNNSHSAPGSYQNGVSIDIGALANTSMVNGGVHQNGVSYKHGNTITTNNAVMANNGAHQYSMTNGTSQASNNRYVYQHHNMRYNGTSMGNNVANPYGVRHYHPYGMVNGNAVAYNAMQSHKPNSGATSNTYHNMDNNGSCTVLNAQNAYICMHTDGGQQCGGPNTMTNGASGSNLPSHRKMSNNVKIIMDNGNNTLGAHQNGMFNMATNGYLPKASNVGATSQSHHNMSKGETFRTNAYQNGVFLQSAASSSDNRNNSRKWIPSTRPGTSTADGRSRAKRGRANRSAPRDNRELPPISTILTRRPLTETTNTRMREGGHWTPTGYPGQGINQVTLGQGEGHWIHDQASNMPSVASTMATSDSTESKTPLHTTNGTSKVPK